MFRNGSSTEEMPCSSCILRAREVICGVIPVFRMNRKEVVWCLLVMFGVVPRMHGKGVECWEGVGDGFNWAGGGVYVYM